MELQVSRRLFVGTLGAGLPLLAAGITTAQDTHQHDADDPVSVELKRQLKAALRGLGGPRHGEASRHLASTVRIAVAQATATGLDAQVIAGVKQAIRARGRDALLTADIAPSRLAAEAREFGVSVPAMTPFDYASRSAVLDAMLKNGITGTWSKAADTFDKLGAEADKALVGIRPIARRLDNPYCIELAQQLQVLQEVTTIACNPITIEVPGMQPICAYAFSIWAGFRLSYALLC